ncbi:UDP-glucose 4-epimerase [Afipia massiliensis]|uniref:UDP-glucose 4-epimerase n=1 Tax=Afipia massiliensis TaxID=211460 RepID=A0A840N4G9_9BRAD|nr:SDR family oxidoreductase [Afipia massiliensis]MBB5053802.1 UDP-glucose 4-epimerase [Afipia massiliensis]
MSEAHAGQYAMHGGVLVTGAAGFIGKSLIAELARANTNSEILALDMREVVAHERLPNVTYLTGDVRDPALRDLFQVRRPQTVVHLASVVAVGGDPQRDWEIDVLGTKNVLQCCVDAGVEHLIVTSSGAAYGYYADNPVPLREDDPLRGNADFPYARNKREVEEMLVEWHDLHPHLEQTVFRPCTVLGPTTNNQITAMFEGPVVLGLSGTSTPFSLIADSDVIDALVQAVRHPKPGTYNLAGDGVLSLREIAALNRKLYVAIPPGPLKFLLWLLQSLRITKLGPGAVKFVQYRPVLANDKLKSEFGFTPRYNARETFERYRDGRAERET